MAYGFRIFCLVSAFLLLAGCVTDSQHNKAIGDIDAFWKKKNDKLVVTEGRRIVQATPREAFIAVQRAAQRLGMIVEDQDRATGFLLASSAAPTPLTQEEWKIVQENDTDEMREVIGETIGAASWFVDLDPTGKEVLANVLVNETGEGTEVSLGIRLRSTRATVERDRRLQPPPTAMRIGMEKFWLIFEEEIGQKPALAMTAPTASAASGNPPESRSAGPVVTNGVENPDGVAVIVGNRAYGGDLPEVTFAHNDADAMRRFVIGGQGFREGNVIDLRDASLVDLNKVFGNEKSHRGQLWRWVRPRESDVVVYYSGHGVPGMHDKRQYILPVNSDPNSPEVGGYALETLYRNLSQLDARSVRVYLDACFSGESQGGSLLKNFSGLAIPAAPETELTVLTAARNEQVASWDVESRQGLFTRFLLEGLQGKADDARYGRRDGRVTLQEIKGYLDREMTYIARRHYGRDQNATVRGNLEEILSTLPR
jgi:hypothetical protein